MQAFISSIEYYLPKATVTTEDLAAQFPEWQMERLDAKTGIRRRHVVAPGECASDLAVEAARKLFASGGCRPEQIDYLLLCTQSPDYPLPTTACLLQRRLGLSTSVGALDFNLGCSGFVYGLGLAQGLIASGQATGVLLITADTLSRYVNPRDITIRALFGDAATATFIGAATSPSPLIGPFVYGTDGGGEFDVIVPAGGMRKPPSPETAREVDYGRGVWRSEDNIYMNGPRIAEFALSAVPRTVDRLLERVGIAREQIDLFVFHQANRYILEELQKVCGIPAEKFQITMEDSGNTSSSTIPIALKQALTEGKLKDGMLLMLVGFGVGLSLSATLVRWRSVSHDRP